MATPPQPGPVTALGRWLARRNLWVRLALGVSLGFIALFVAFSIIGELALQASAAQIRTERLTIAQITALEIDQLLVQAVGELEQARRFTDFDPADADHGPEAAILAHAYGPGGHFAGGVAFLDGAGRVVVAQPPTFAAPGDDLSGAPFAGAALAAGQTSISAPFLNPADGHPMAAVTVPVVAGGQQLGLITGLLDLSGEPILGLLDAAATLGKTGHAVLFDAEGRTLIATSDVTPLGPGEHGIFFRQTLVDRMPVVASVPYELDGPGEPRGHAHVMAAATLARAPWGVAVGGDESETYAGLRGLRLGLINLGLAALAAVWAVTLVGARRLVSPVQRLTAAAERIAAGDLQTPLTLPEGGEIGALAGALDHMRAQLLSSIDELAALNSSLEGRVAERTDELRHQTELAQQLLGRVITAQEDERARLSRELHDEVGQMLTAVQLGLDRLGKALPADDGPSRERLATVRELVGQTLSDLRRMIADLRPGVLDQLGLLPALAWVAEHTLDPLGIQTSIEAPDPHRRLPPPIETLLFRIAQEAMHNTARHSGASRVQITLAYADGAAILTIVDDGRGFDPAAAAAAADRRSGLGLAGIAERAALAGGAASIVSAPGAGTTVAVSVPVPG